MARQRKIILSGKIGNVVLYELNGVPVARSLPAEVKQTEATIARQKQFGKAIRIAKHLRAGLSPVLPDAKDQSMILRLNNALYHWIMGANPDKDTVAAQLPFINPFEFNPESELVSRLKKKPVINWTNAGGIILAIPALDPAVDIAAPAYTETIHWKIGAVSASLDGDTLTGNYMTDMEMPYTKGPQPEKQLHLPGITRPNEITVVAIELRYVVKRKGELHLVEEKKWMPAGVVGSCCGKMG